MLKNFFPTFINLTLRVTSLVSKFFLIIFISKNLGVESLGDYGLFVTTITFSIYLLGFDFYNFNTREILSSFDNRHSILIRDQFVFHCLAYVFILPLLLSIFFFKIIDAKFIFLFYSVLLVEHISQEMYRLLITLKRPTQANFSLFIRSGAWVYILLGLWHFEVINRITLDMVWYSWCVAGTLSIITAFFGLKEHLNYSSLNKPVDWKWILKGLKTSIPFFIGTIAYKVIEFSDRYMIDLFMTKEDVGVYSFFYGIANVLSTIVFTAVIMVIYPIMVESFHKKDFVRFKANANRMRNNILVYSLVTSVLIMVFIEPLLNYIGKAELSDNLFILWGLIFSVFILNLSMVTHYTLYCAKKDNVIRNATVISAFINVILNTIFINYLGLVGAIMASVISYGYVWIHKLYAVRSDMLDVA